MFSIIKNDNNLSMFLSIKQFKIFLAVIKENYFSSAENRLKNTQSEISMLVQNLELSFSKKYIKKIYESNGRKSYT
tara:strand:+ start:81 stop:308 length:228 start_codon:yes stop_codon:yes gene_type:complete